MITVRPAALDDLEAVTRLFTGYLEFYREQHEEAAVAGFVRARLEAGDSCVLLAERDDEGSREAVGMAQSYPISSSLTLGPAWVLYDLFVAPAARGVGAGRALVRATCAAAAAAGAHFVQLETAHSNTAAQALYEQEGFALDTEFRVYAHQLRR